MSAPSYYDVAIAGAGVLGASIAVHMARKGARVVVLDGPVADDGSGTGTTPRSFGLVWVQSKEPGVYLALSMASADLYPDYLTLIGDDCEYVRPGGMLWAETSADLARLAGLMQQQRQTIGFVADVLSGDQARQREPGLSPHLAGATWCPLDGHLNPRILWRAGRAAATRWGADVRERAPVERLIQTSSGYQIVAGAHTILAAKVVVAAGLWTPQLTAQLGAAVPVETVLGQIVATEIAPFRVNHPTPDFRQDAAGRLWIGTTHERGRRDLGASEQTTATLRRRMAMLYPATKDLATEEVWAGIRPMPPDGHPILGRLPGQEHAYVAVTHSGITLAPVIGRAMADLVLYGRTDPLIVPFGTERFTSR